MPRPSARLRRRRRPEAVVELEDRFLLATFFVKNTFDSGPDSLRHAIERANANPGADNIEFRVPASTVAALDVSVPGFDRVSQTWTISLQTPLPALTDTVHIDALSQGHGGVPFAYGGKNDIQRVVIDRSVTGGTFELLYPYNYDRGETILDRTTPIPFNADALTIRDALLALPNGPGPGDIVVTGGPLSVAPVEVEFTGALQRSLVFAMSADSTNLVAPDPLPTLASVVHLQFGSDPLPPTLIHSVPNAIPALNGNDAKLRVVLDGSAITTGDAIAFDINSSHTIIRGFAIVGFDRAFHVRPAEHQLPLASPPVILDPHDGVLIQGNSIGAFRVFPVDYDTGISISGAGAEIVVTGPIREEAIVLEATNTTIGGFNPQENNIICNAGQDGILITSTGIGNQVRGNQIGIIGPTTLGFYSIVPNAREDLVRLPDGPQPPYGTPEYRIVVDAAMNSLRHAAVRVLGPSNSIGGQVTGSGNLISGNDSHGIWLDGKDAIATILEGNVIGVGPGGGLRFGASDTGNRGDGVRIQNTPDTVVGGAGVKQRNTIAANEGAGVRITGENALRTRVLGNIIGLQVDGQAAMGNSLEGVLIEDRASESTIGPGNVISASLRGVYVIGANTKQTVIVDNYIGTDSKGLADLGNAKEGIRIEGAPYTTIQGDGKGSQLISGNDAGLAVVGASVTNARIVGNWIGLDSSGLVHLGNSKQGILFENTSSSHVGGPSPTLGNKIMANHWGIVLTGEHTKSNQFEGNYIAYSELQGVLIENNASENTFGGLDPRSGNTITANVSDGVRIVSGDKNTLLSNQIFANGQLGIDLGGDGPTPNGIPPRPGPNVLLNAPIVTAALTSGTLVNVQGTWTALPDKAVTIQFFASSAEDPSHYGEGERYLATLPLVTDSNGIASFKQDLLVEVPLGWFITATATDDQGNTSEFSNAKGTENARVRFQSPAVTRMEGATTFSLAVVRSGALGAAVEVRYSLLSGTALAGVDFEDASGTMTFAPNINSASIQFTLRQDTLVEGDETFRVVLSDPSTGAILESPSECLVTISDDDLFGVHFATPWTVVSETTGTARIDIVRDGATGPGAVRVLTNGGSAVAGVNYTAIDQVITFETGEYRKSIALPVLHDPANSGDKVVVLTLASTSTLVVTGAQSQNVVILDVDQAGSVRLGGAAFSISEMETQVVIPVYRVGGSAGTLQVVYGVAGTSAVPGVDFTPVGGTLTFPPGVTTATITVPLLNPHRNEGNLNFVVGIAGVGAATVNAPTNAIVTIRDDEPDWVAPVVTDVLPMADPRGLTGLVVTFSEPIDAARGAIPLSYDENLWTPGRDSKFGTADDLPVRIVAVIVAPGGMSVTLLPVAPVPFGRLARLSINRQIMPLIAPGVADRAGNLLDGDFDGRPGGVFTTTVGLGPRIAWSDRDGDTASLQLDGGGLIWLGLGTDQQVQSVRLVGVVPGRSSLSGRVTKARTGDGRAVLPVIQGATGTAVRLPTPPFVGPGSTGAAVPPGPNARPRSVARWR